MKNIIKISLISFLFLGCASTQKHDHYKGSVVALDSDETAHVCMNATDVNKGDVLDVFKVTCKKNPRIAGVKNLDQEPTVCQRDFLGKANVIEKTDNHFIKIKPEGNLKISEGLIVEVKN